MGIVIKDIVAKFSAVKAVLVFSKAGIHLAKPVLGLAITAFKRVAKEPTITNGIKIVKALLIEVKY